MNDRNSPKSMAFWIELLNAGILTSGVDEATTAALCSHLADLNVLKKDGEDWTLVPCSEGSLKIEQEMEKTLRDLCATEKGFAVRYFLDSPPSFPMTHGLQDQDSSNTEEKSKSNSQLLGQKTSNLSNLQIVSKYGRQVQSFIELEKNYTEKLLGPNTSAKEARKIFNFILSRMKQKTEPRPWEQLSRRRHK